MSIFPNLLRSLLLTGIFSFLAPVLLLGGLLLTLLVVEHIPGLHLVGQFGANQLSSFLTIFGNGSLMQGLLLIGSVCSLVGILFDTFTLYRQQNLKDL